MPLCMQNLAILMGVCAEGAVHLHCKIRALGRLEEGIVSYSVLVQRLA